MFAQQRPGPHIEVTGTLPGSGTTEIDVRGLWCPLTVSLASVAAGRRIELSNDGVTWFDGALDLTAGNQIAIVLAAPLRTVRLTGAPGDVWGIT
jgi:hypothetical protein